MLRRFLIWSGLAVVLGLALSLSGYLAYDHFYARFQPVTITRQQGEIQRLLDEASWISAGGGDRTVYVVGSRDGGPAETYLHQEASRLRAAGADVRTLIIARPARTSTPAERATIAELWLHRDESLLRRWLAAPAADWTAEGLVPADGSLARSGVVEASRDFVRSLSGLMREVGVKPTWPLVIWRDRQGFLKACACADSRSWAAVRADFGASETPPPASPMPVPPLAAPAPVPAEPTYQGLPYPDPVIAPPVRTPPPAASSRPPAPPSPRSAQPGASSPPRSAPSPTRPPQASPPQARPPQARPPQPRPAQPSRPGPPPRGARIEPDSLFY